MSTICNAHRIAGLTLLLVPLVYAADHERVAVFSIGQTIVQSNPPGFGAEYVPQLRVNNWTDNQGMEPLTIYDYWELSGAGSDSTGAYAVCNTRKWDCLSSGFLDGGHYRLYREVTNVGAGRVEIQKVREGTIPPGGFIAAGYEEIGLNAVRTLPPATDAVDNYRIANGETWYYSVRAQDVSGNWSADSAPLAGVTPVASSNNGPRMVTAAIANPTLGRNYTTSSPLVTMAAAGGTAPLSWSLSAGALPAGLVLLASGAITGMCSASAVAACTVQVSDNAARVHTRPFVIFGASPAAVAGAPHAPGNIVLEANNGFVYLRWDPSPESDVTAYKVFRSRWPASQHRECIYLGSGGPAAQARDLLFVEKHETNAPPPQTRSMRVLALQSETAWRSSGNSVTQQIVPHPLPLPAPLQSNDAGVSCLKITAPSSGEFGIWQFRYSWTGDTWWGATMLPTGRTYRMECWVRGEGLAGSTVRFRMPSYHDRTVTGVINDSWVKLATEFTVTNWLQSSIGVVGPNFLFQGPGTVYVDNAVVYDLHEPRGACHFTQPIFDLWQQYLGPREREHKGALRTRYMSESFAHVVNPGMMSCRSWDGVYGGRVEDPMHLHDTLQASYESGDTPATRTIPWITANLNWTEEDYVHLVEYLAGPAGTPYGDLRIAQRGGITTPWINEFRAIYIEMGNEPWNSGYFFAFRGGFSSESARTYGRWCQYIWEYVDAHCPYATNAIKVLVGGWAGSLGWSDFTAQARMACPRAERVGLTTYLGGWEAGQGGQVGGSIWTDEGVQQWTTFRDLSGGAYIDHIRTLQDTLAATGAPFEVVMYEGGPSYLMNGLNGVSLTAQEQEVSRNYGRTLAAGLGTLDFWLYGMYRGIKEQEYFIFGEDKGLWASHTFVYQGYRPHPAWQVLQMVNNYCGAGAMLVTSSEAVPCFDLLNTNGTAVLQADITLASVYAFRRGNDYLVLAMNKKVDGVHNGLDFGDGSMPLTLRLPFTNPSRIMLYKLSGNPRLTNRQQLTFQIVTQEIATAQFACDFVVSDLTGGVSNGLPVGAVYVYVFENCTADALPATPQVAINQAATQADPNDGSVANTVRFTAVFDRPVRGFTNAAAALVIGGTADPQTATITPVAASLGTTYDIAVGGMRRAGTVSARVLANAAWAVADGQPISASTARDNVVTNLFPAGVALAEWEFASSSDPFYQNPTSTYQHPYVAPVILAPGPGLNVGANVYNNDDAYGVTGVNSPTQDWTDYIAWSLQPTNGWAMSISTISFGGCGQATGDDLYYALHWSTNGFLTAAALPLLPTNRIIANGLSSSAGTRMDADMTNAAGLADYAVAVQFRVYIWGCTGVYSGSGIGKLGAATPDLQIKGALAPRVPYIVTHPQDQSAEVDMPAVFSVETDGIPPFYYQWRHDGLLLADATAVIYQLAAVQFAHTGLYSVVVSNLYGTALSQSAMLTIIPEPVALASPVIVLALCAGQHWRVAA